MPEVNEITIAVIHSCIEIGNRAKNIARIGRIIEKLGGSNSVDLVVAPQMINGIPLYKHPTIIKARKGAETIPGSTTQEMSNIANRYNRNLLVGPILERRGTKLYRSAFLVIPILGIKGVVRQLEGFEGYGSNIEVPLFDVNKFKVGVVIAEDIFYPEISLLLDLMGIDTLIFYPTFDINLNKQRHLMMVRAIETKCTSIMVGGTMTKRGEVLLEIPTIAVDENGDTIEELGGGEDKVLLIKVGVKSSKEITAQPRKNVLVKLRKLLSYFTK
ncbi:MAG: carbon-nitrogen hydrolase family protein [Ignisphaera sp.]